MNAHACLGMSVRLLLVAALALSISGAALAQLPESRDMTGSWLGRWNDKSVRGPGGRGVIGFDVSQGGPQGTFTGLATPRDESAGQLELEGVYEMVGRRMSGQVVIRVQGSGQFETATFTGRCSKKGKAIKMKFLSPDDRTIKIKVRRFLSWLPSEG